MTQEPRQGWLAAAHDSSSPEYALVRLVLFAIATLVSAVAAVWVVGIGLLAVFFAFGTVLWVRRWSTGGWGRQDR